MFAFAVWDEQDRTLFLARDRMGQKPLYVVAGAMGESFPASDLRMDQYGSLSAVAFASEPAAVLALPWVERAVSPSAVPHYLRYGYTNWTAFESVGAIDPGCSMTVGHQSVQDRQYFSVDDAALPTVTADPVATTRTLVRRAVERQLITDVPLGVFLSGGVDSSVVAAAARRLGPVQTFSIGFPDPRYDETEHAVAVARHLGTDHHVFRFTPDAATDLPLLAGLLGTPFADSSALPTRFLAGQTRQHVKVALSGDGGDELFGGYDRYRAMAWGRRLAALAPLGRLAAGWRRGHPKSAFTKAGRFAASLHLPEGDRYEGYLRLFDEPTLRAMLLHPPALDNRPTTWHLASLYDRFRGSGRDAVQAALATDRTSYLPDDLLTKADRCSMLHGLEVRSPFMDPDVVTFAAGLTTDQLLKGGPKRMLREAFAGDLPAWVFRREKMGFAVPVGDWFRGPLRAMLRDTLFSAHAFGRTHFDMAVVQRLVDEHESRRVDHGQRLYALLMLELWWDTVRATA